MTGIVRALLETSSITPELMTSTIQAVSQEYENEGCSIREIGSGMCDSFANDVLERLGYPHNITEWGTEYFWKDTFEADLNKVRELGGNIPDDVDPQALEELLGRATHTWLYFQGKHYDAEAPKGVDDFFQLPFFARQIDRLRNLNESFFANHADILMPVIRELMKTAARPLIYKLWKRGSKNAVAALAALKKLRDQGDPNPIQTLYQMSDLDVPTQFLKRLAWEAGLHDIPGVRAEHKPGLLPAGEITEKIDTGSPVEIEYVRNTEGAPDMGDKFGQHIEPAGRYMVAKHGSVPEGWETGTVHFNNPLVINWGSGLYTDKDNWKQVLYRKYGKTGKALSRALCRDGYDGIITMRDGETSEIVDLTGIQK